MEPICEVQGIFKFVNGDYEMLEEIGRDAISHDAHLFFALNFPKKPESKMVIMDVIYDANKRSKNLIRDPHKVNGHFEEMGTDVDGECVFLGYIEFPPYDKYRTAGKHSVKIQVANFTSEKVRDFSPENGGVSAEFDFVIVDDRKE